MVKGHYLVSAGIVLLCLNNLSFILIYKTI